MSSGGFHSVVPGADDITVTVDEVPISLRRGRSLLAALLLTDRAGAAADFFCAIGQCQRCVVTVDGRPRLACMTYPAGGETVSTRSTEDRLPPWPLGVPS